MGERALQNALQMLPTIGTVTVARSNPDPNGGFEWYVTFASNFGDLEAMEVDVMRCSQGCQWSEGQEASPSELFGGSSI